MQAAHRPAFIVVFAALAALALAVYAPCLRGPFLWDDRSWSLGIDWLLTDPKALWFIWTNPLVVEQYYPLTTTTVWLDYQLWGWDVLPRHVENVLLHALSAACLWRLLVRLEVRGAWLAALLLAVHPVMVESVAWITERKNALCLALSMLSLLAWGKSTGWWQDDAPPRRGWQWAATGLLVLALLAKITAFAVVPAIVILTWWKRGAVRPRDLVPMLPMAIATLGLGLMVCWLEKYQAGATGPFFDELTAGRRCFIAGAAVWFYAGKLLWPLHTCVLYDRWPVTGAWWEWLAVAALLATAVMLWRTRNRAVQSAALFMFVPLIPVSGLMNVNGMRYAWVADRWVYFSAPAFFAAEAWLLARWLPPRVHAVVGVVLVLGCGVLANRHAAAFGDMDRFWQAAIAGGTHPATAHSSYADALMKEGRLDEAGRHFEAALQLEPRNSIMHCNIGAYHAAAGRPEDALKSYDRSLELDPTESLVHYNRGFVMTALGRLADAEASFRTALKLSPRMLAARNDLASLLINKREFAEAEEHLRQSLAIRPGDSNANGALGNLRYRQGRKSEALACFEAALQRKPDLIPALSNAARIMATSGDATLRNGPRARELALRAAELSERKNAGVLNTLAAAYAENGQFAEAVSTAKEALALAESGGQASLVDSMRAAVRVFESGQPFRTQD